MKKNWRPFMLMLLAFGLSGPGVFPAAAAEKFHLAATIFPLADICRRIAGPDIRVIQILPAGASPHTFDLTPGQVRELQTVRLVFKIGLIDDWIDNIADSLPAAAIISLHTNIALKPFREEGHRHGHAPESGQREFDPHYWLDAENGVILARAIAAALSAADPSRAAFYEQNYRNYAGELARLHAEIKEALSALKNRKIIVFHDAWRYFAAAYGLEIVAVFQVSPGREPSPRQLQALYGQVRRHGVQAIFSEPQLPTTSLEPLLQDLGLKRVVLDPLGGSLPNDSYAALLRRNAQAIAGSLNR